MPWIWLSSNFHLLPFSLYSLNLLQVWVGNVCLASHVKSKYSPVTTHKCQIAQPSFHAKCGSNIKSQVYTKNSCPHLLNIAACVFWAFDIWSNLQKFAQISKVKFIQQWLLLRQYSRSGCKSRCDWKFRLWRSPRQQATGSDLCIAWAGDSFLLDGSKIAWQYSKESFLNDNGSLLIMKAQARQQVPICALHEPIIAFSQTTPSSVLLSILVENAQKNHCQYHFWMTMSVYLLWRPKPGNRFESENCMSFPFSQRLLWCASSSKSFLQWSFHTGRESLSSILLLQRCFPFVCTVVYHHESGYQR